jgi:hypothetical protein
MPTGALLQIPDTQTGESLAGPNSIFAAFHVKRAREGPLEHMFHVKHFLRIPPYSRTTIGIFSIWGRIGSSAKVEPSTVL